MSFDISGFDQDSHEGSVVIRVQHTHPLLKLSQALDWPSLLAIILPDLKRTEKCQWWKGRPLSIRIHLGIYLLQQLFNLTDRKAEYDLKDNAAFQLFCGGGRLQKWHTPDHTKIEAFRSCLQPETQRQLANILAKRAVKLGYAASPNLDIDSTIQAANITYSSRAKLLVKIAILAKRLISPLNELNCNVLSHVHYSINLRKIKAKAFHYFNQKRKKLVLCQEALKSLWQTVFKEVLPIVKDSYKLINRVALPSQWSVRYNLGQLQCEGGEYLKYLYGCLFEDQPDNRYTTAFHVHEIAAFNKKKLNRPVEYGRAYQLGRIEGNFMIVGACTSVYMSDAASLPSMIKVHEDLFGESQLNSVSVDRGYYSSQNQALLERKNVTEIGLSRPDRPLCARRNRTLGNILEKLYCRRAGIEPLIGHLKQSGQMGRSRMKKDVTTLSAGYGAVLGFNLRPLKNALLDENRVKIGKIATY